MIHDALLERCAEAVHAAAEGVMTNDNAEQIARAVAEVFAEDRARLVAAAEALLDLCAPLSRRTASDDATWEAAVRGLRAAVGGKE